MAGYKSKAARCLRCGILIKMEPCDQCESGYWPDVCPACGTSDIKEVADGLEAYTLIAEEE